MCCVVVVFNVLGDVDLAADADRCGELLPGRRDPTGRANDAAHLRRLPRAPHAQLSGHQCPHPLHQLLHKPLLPNQLRHLLWHVAAVP